ncbi:uncharacterized protein DEA37_0012625, partial [Paragonimus westermani]
MAARRWWQWANVTHQFVRVQPNKILRVSAQYATLRSACWRVAHPRITQRVPHDMNVPGTVTFDSPWIHLSGANEKIASPLHQLTEKGKKFVWSAECHAVLNTLKGKLSSPSILAFPDFSPSAGPFILDTDASDQAIGAALSQKSANGVVVIAYAIRRLDKRERRYCTMRRQILNGPPSTTWLRSFREPEGQVARWLEHLQDYDFDCIYRPDSRHANADALSRFTTTTVNAMLSIPSVGAARAHYQLNDLYISDIYGRRLDRNPKPTGRGIEGRSPEERCLWSQCANLRSQTNVQTNRSSGKVSKFVREVHVELGHAGQRRTEAAVRQRFWWSKLHDDVVRNCANCNICAQTKSPTVDSGALLQMVAAVGPNHRVGVD